MELHRSSFSILSRRQWLGIAAFVCVALAFYLISYWNDPNLPGKSTLGWWGWFDQGQYYRSVVALEQNNYEPSEHHYPVGYALIGTLFYRVMPEHPFLIPNLVFYGLICFAFLQVCRVLVSFEWALILCFFGVVWPTTVQANLIYPWTNTPVNAALVVMAYLALARIPDRLNGIWTGICAGLIFMVRPGDLVYSWPLMAVLWLGGRGWQEAWRRARWFLAGTLPLVGLASYFSIAIHGHLVSEGYRRATGYIGFGFASLGVKLYTFFVDAFPIFGEKRTLVVVFPVVLFILPGVVTFVKELKWRGIAVVAAQLGAVAYFLAYNDYWVSNAFKFHGIRVWLWLIPFVGLYAYLTFRLAWRSLGWVATALLLVGPLVFWDAVGMEIRPVFWEPAPAAGSGCAAKVTPASDLSDDDATTGWRGDKAGVLGAGAGSGLWLCSEGHARERSLRRRRHDGMAVRTRRRRILQHGAGVRKAGAIRHAAVGGHPIEQAAICKPLVGRPAESDVLRTVFFRRTRWAIPAHLLPASNRSIHPVDDPAAGRGESTLGVRGPALYAELEIVFAKSAGPLSSEPRHAAKRRLSNC